MGLHGKNLILFQVSTQTNRKITSGSRGSSLSQTQKKRKKKKKGGKSLFFFDCAQSFLIKVE